jgi:pimeloyl-ACP methyl ester carboxylesterase
VRKGLPAALVAFGLLAPGAQGAEPQFHPCRQVVPAAARCGHVSVPLDRQNPTGEKLRIGFELYRRRDRERPSLGTLVDVEGGPGGSSTDSRYYFLGLNRPLMDRRDVVLFDARGTGTSGALDCRALRSTVRDYIVRAGRCAAQLGARADRYNTRESVDDLADVLDALGIPVVDLYGDSYGSYFAQAFAVNHPHRLRSLVLDGTYPLPGTDPALGDLAEATWRALRLVCARRPSCAARDEDPLAVVQRLAERVRADRVRGVGTDAEGDPRRVVIDVDSVVTLLQTAYGNPPVYRDVLGAIRAFEHGDRAPLLRLVAETKETDEPYPVQSFSEALYLAVTCHDYPQMWDPAAPLATRMQQLAATRAALPPVQFAPFTGTEWSSQQYEGAAACLRWPAPLRADPPVPPAAPYPAVPTLVVNGDLDNITTTAQALVVASRFPGSTFVETQNTLHVSALGDRDGCAAPIVRRFIRTLSAGDTSCARRIAEVRVVDRFPRRASGAEPADPLPGDRSTVRARRVAAVAAATVADAIQRWTVNYGGTSRGLRGGRWGWSGDRVTRFRFRGARFTEDVPVFGRATWRLGSGALRADLTIPGRGHVAARWNLRSRLATATLTGRLDDRRLRATMLAP